MKTIRLRHLAAPILAAFVLLGAGCSDHFGADGNLAGPGGMGATQGGVQDMQFARELISSGMVPPPEAFTVEGMFSEHDLPLAGDPPTEVLTLRGAAGCAPDLAGEPRGWLQVGMSSSVDPETFERTTLSVIACVDVSGSMGWSYGGDDTEYPTPGSVARRLLRAIAAELGGDDRCAIVTYGSNVATPLPPVAGDSPRIAEVIDALGTNGSTNMEAGLRRAFAVAHEELAAETAAVRVMLFTDIQPNVGATDAGSFREMAGAAADEGVGLTVFGLGVGMRQEVMNAITDLRGGNAFSLFDHDDVDALMDDSWPWMVSPIAHALTMSLAVPAELAVSATYGFPGDTAELAVASVFLSRRRGALLVELRPTGEAFPAGAVVTGELAYLNLGGATVQQSLQWTLPAPGDLPTFEQPIVGRTVALAMLVDGMKAAATDYGDAPEAAIARMEAVCARFAQDIEQLADADLETERGLGEALLQLMVEGAPQGDMYGDV
ncbi:MAG: VWA domain-containing protein [Candidatus Krumholzibacteriia bacterium]